MNALKRDDYEGNNCGYGQNVTVEYYIKFRIADERYVHDAIQENSLAKKHISREQNSFRIFFRGIRK